MSYSIFFHVKHIINQQHICRFWMGTYLWLLVSDKRWYVGNKCTGGTVGYSLTQSDLWGHNNFCTSYRRKTKVKSVLLKDYSRPSLMYSGKFQRGHIREIWLFNCVDKEPVHPQNLTNLLVHCMFIPDNVSVSKSFSTSAPLLCNRWDVLDNYPVIQSSSAYDLELNWMTQSHL